MLKKVVSISLGSSKRDYSCIIEILGEKYHIERIGSDGNFDMAIKIINELDGKVDAFGMGGIDLFLRAGKRSYTLRDAIPLKLAAKKTPIYDGSTYKSTMENKLIFQLMEEGIINFQNKPVLITSALDRYGMAEAIKQCGGKLTIGDLIFGLQLNVPLYSLDVLNFLSILLLPIASRLPFKMLYPIGKSQHNHIDKFSTYYRNAEIIAGDFHYIKRYMPRELHKKIIITNTVTKEDVEQLKNRGVKTLITTTPKLGERSFGTNVIEALIETIIKDMNRSGKLKTYSEVFKVVGLKPRVEFLS